MSLSDKICILPWISIETSPVGTVRPCCLAKEEIYYHNEYDDSKINYNLKDHTPEEIYHSRYMQLLRRDFLYGQKPEQVMAFEHIISVVKQHGIIEEIAEMSSNSIEIICQNLRRIQIILTNYTNPKDILRNFDLWASSVYYNGRDVIGNLNFIYSMKFWQEKIDNRELKPKSILRIAKYMSKGLRLHIGYKESKYNTSIKLYDESGFKSKSIPMNECIVQMIHRQYGDITYNKNRTIMQDDFINKWYPRFAILKKELANVDILVIDNRVDAILSLVSEWCDRLKKKIPNPTPTSPDDLTKNQFESIEFYQRVSHEKLAKYQQTQEKLAISNSNSSSCASSNPDLTPDPTPDPTLDPGIDFKIDLDLDSDSDSYIGGMGNIPGHDFEPISESGLESMGLVLPQILPQTIINQFGTPVDIVCVLDDTFDKIDYLHYVFRVYNHILRNMVIKLFIDGDFTYEETESKVVKLKPNSSTKPKYAKVPPKYTLIIKNFNPTQARLFKLVATGSDSGSMGKISFGPDIIKIETKNSDVCVKMQGRLCIEYTIDNRVSYFGFNRKIDITGIYKYELDI